MMIMIHIFLFFSSHLCAIPFLYDFASHAVQSGNLDNAQDKLKKLVIDNPDRADVLYDLGVVSYEKGDASQANAYFCKAAECENVAQGLKEQAHFNSGNTYVALKELKQAIEQYECTLAINAENEYAKHNLDVTRQMLEQQKQQEQQQQKQDQQNQNDQQQSCNDQNNESNQPEQQKDGKQSDSEQNKNQENKNQDDSDHGSEKDQGDQAEAKTERNSGEQDRNEDGQGDEADDNERDRNDDSEQKPKQHETDQQQQDRREHTASSQKNASYSQDKNSQHEKQGSIAMQADLYEKEEQRIKDPWLVDVLKTQEEKDKQANKKLMEAKIHDVCAGKDGQNCW